MEKDLIAKYSSANTNTLSDYILALTKTSGELLQDLIDRYQKELEPFVSEKQQLYRFVDDLLDVVRDLRVVDEESFQAHFERNSNGRRIRPQRDVTRRLNPYAKPQERQERPQRMDIDRKSRSQTRFQTANTGAQTNKIQLANVPSELLTPSAEYTDPEAMIREYFGKYGQIKTVSIYPYDGRCEIVFGGEGEDGIEAAKKAVSDPSAIFNNRFVKVFMVREPVKEVPDNLQEVQMTIKMTREELEQRKAEAAKAKESLREQMEILARKQDEERKKLLSNLATVAEADKQLILNSLSSVSQTIKALPAVKPQIADDMSLASYHTELESLKEEHKTLGLPGTTPQLAAPLTHWRAKPTRGRGGRQVMSLDNRLRTVLVSPYTTQLATPLYEKANGQSGPSILLKHLQQYGYIEGSEALSDGAGGVSGLYVRYSKRWEAEKAISNGSSVTLPDQSVVQVQLQWAQSNDVVSAQKSQRTESAAQGDKSFVFDVAMEQDVEME